MAIAIAMLASTVAMVAHLVGTHAAYASKSVAVELDERDATPQPDSADTAPTNVTPLDMSEALTEDVDDGCALVALVFVCPTIATWTNQPAALERVAREHPFGPQRPPRG